MTPLQLTEILSKLNAVRSGSGIVGRCLNCQSDEDDVERFKLQITSGESFPVLVFCHRCGIPKPQTEEERKHNRKLSRTIFAKTGADLDSVYERMSSESIRELWESVKVDGAPVRFNDAEDENRADDDTLHAVYSRMLEGLTLTDRHRKWLSRKGLDSDWAFSVGYRSTGTETIWSDDAIEGVPGLSGRRWLLRENALLIPVRDRQQRIGAIKQRLFVKRSRMRLLSGGGTKAKWMAHYPYGSTGPTDLALWVTEGERKADVLYHQMGVPVVGLCGVGFVSRIVSECVSAGSVVLAFDDDDAGHKAESKLVRLLERTGTEIEQAVWSGFKGIDDAIVGGAKIELRAFESRLKEVEREDNNLLPNQKPANQKYQFRQSLSDHQILDYVRQFQPVLRTDVMGFSPTITKLIADGKLNMTKTKDGQVLKVEDR